MRNTYRYPTGGPLNLWRLAKRAGELSLTKIIPCAVALCLCSAETSGHPHRKENPRSKIAHDSRNGGQQRDTRSDWPRIGVFDGQSIRKETDDQGHFELKVPLHEASRHGHPGRSLDRFLFLWRRTARRDSVFFRVLHGAKAPVFGARKWDQGRKWSWGRLRNHHPLDARSAHHRHVNLPTNDGRTDSSEIYRREVQDAARIGFPGTTPDTGNGEFRFANLRKGDYKLFTNELLDRDS